MKNICDKCGGAGTLTKEPEVITVRITKGGSVFGEGKVHQVKPSFIHNIIGYTDKGWAVYEDIAEVIPPYDKTKYRLRRKWGKDEEKVYDGDMSYHKGVWSVVIFGGPLPQQRKYIYITPIKPATPDPSAAGLPFVTDELCHKCNFYFCTTKKQEDGSNMLDRSECHKRSPQNIRYTVKDGTDGEPWPHVEPHDFCGDYVEMKKESE